MSLITTSNLLFIFAGLATLGSASRDAAQVEAWEWLARLTAQASTKLESELNADLNRVEQADGEYKAAEAEVAKELKALANGTSNLQDEVPAEETVLSTKIAKVLETPPAIEETSASSGATSEAPSLSGADGAGRAEAQDVIGAGPGLQDEEEVATEKKSLADSSHEDAEANVTSELPSGASSSGEDVQADVGTGQLSLPDSSGGQDVEEEVATEKKSLADSSHEDAEANVTSEPLSGPSSSGEDVQADVSAAKPTAEESSSGEDAEADDSTAQPTAEESSSSEDVEAQEDDDSATTQSHEKEFGGDCPPVELVGYNLMLRGSWTGKMEVAIKSSLQQCASLCSSDPTCHRFSLQVVRQGSGVCSHYRKKDGTPTRSSSCTYAFDKVDLPQARTAKEDVSSKSSEQGHAHSAPPKKTATEHSQVSNRAIKSSRKEDVLDTIPEPSLASARIQDKRIAKNQEAAFRGPKGVQLLPDPSENNGGYKGKKPGPMVLMLKDPRKWSASTQAWPRSASLAEAGRPQDAGSSSMEPPQRSQDLPSFLQLRSFQPREAHLTVDHQPDDWR